MERSDFSVPRRMSKSAFIILLVKELLSYAGPFLIWAIIKLFNSGRQRSLMETMEMLLFLFICYLIFSVVTAFISYYYKKYYIKNGNLIFIYGFLKKETVIPLQKIQSLRTRRGFMYNPQIQISAESETKRSIFREKDKTKRSKKESAQHSKSRNKSFVMTSVSAL